MPPKTGSVHAAWVFQNFGFQEITCSYDRKEIYKSIGHLNNNHILNLFENHEDYKLICTARNPLLRIFSAFVYSNSFFKKQTNIGVEITPKNFIKFFVETLYDNDSVWLQGMNFMKRKPDYFIKLENLYEDYSKIPFIQQSEMFLNGTLKSMCEEKKNSAGSGKYNVKEFYTNDMIDTIYKRYKDYFDLLGYEPKI